MMYFSHKFIHIESIIWLKPPHHSPVFLLYPIKLPLPKLPSYLVYVCVSHSI